MLYTDESRWLLSEKSRRRGQGLADIQLSDGDLDAEGSERLKVLLERRGHFADDEVALEADAVDGDVLGLEALDEVEHGGGLCAGGLDIVVVDVELGGRVGGAGGFESEGDEGGAEGVVEDVTAPCSVIVEWL